MDIYEILTLIGMAVISLLISSYIGYKALRNSHFIEETIEETLFSLLEEAQTNENMQKQVYTIGALLGNGIAAGSGMKNSFKGGGKLSINNVIAEIASNWIGNIKPSSSPSYYQSPPSSSPTDLNTRKVSDKW